MTRTGGLRAGQDAVVNAARYIQQRPELAMERHPYLGAGLFLVNLYLVATVIAADVIPPCMSS
jgi:hypothetical protein